MKQSLRGPALYTSIRDYIKEYILEHDLKPGDSLPPEGQLVEDLGVGRSSVREAVKSLQSVGIVDVRQGNGLYVRELNFDPMLETFLFGMQFDPHTLAAVSYTHLDVYKRQKEDDHEEGAERAACHA